MSKRNSRVPDGLASRLLKSGTERAEEGDLAAALREYTKLVDVAPDFSGGFSNRANVLVGLKRYEEALGDYDRAMELAPLSMDAPTLLLNRGVTRSVMGNRQGALADFNAGLTIDRFNLLLLANKGRVCVQLGRYDEAVAAYGAVVNRKPNDVQPFWLDYGLLKLEMELPLEALGILKRVAVQYTTVDDAHAALAVALAARGDELGAEAEWAQIKQPDEWRKRRLVEERFWPPRAVAALESFKPFN